ncbi:MAG: chromate transporter [Firmicutes bacterium]|jgi:chromate transporter|nr:chromate transporter [Bacillota bacterium]
MDSRQAAGVRGLGNEMEAKDSPCSPGTAPASLWDMFWTFFRIGAFTIGGGYVMVPLIQKDVVDRKGWVAKDDFVDVLGVAQTAPGPIAVNTSVYIGYMLRGFAGAAVSVAGCIIPSIVIIMAIASVFDRISSLRVVQAAFAGIRPAVAVLIASAAVKLGKPVVRSGGELAIAAAALVMVSFFNISPALVIVIAALAGLMTGVGGDSA